MRLCDNRCCCYRALLRAGKLCGPWRAHRGGQRARDRIHEVLTLVHRTLRGWRCYRSAALARDGPRAVSAKAVFDRSKHHLRAGSQTPAHTRIRVACFAYVSDFAIFKFRPFRFSLFATCFHMHCITQHGEEDRQHKACTFVERSGQPCTQNSEMPGSVDASHPL